MREQIGNLQKNIEATDSPDHESLKERDVLHAKARALKNKYNSMFAKENSAPQRGVYGDFLPSYKLPFGDGIALKMATKPLNFGAAPEGHNDAKRIVESSDAHVSDQTNDMINAVMVDMKEFLEEVHKREEAERLLP